MASKRSKKRSLILEKLDELGIIYEEVTYSISPNLKHFRDWEWEYILRGNQIIDIEKVGGKLQLIAFNGDGIKTEIGKTSVFTKDVDFKKGIILDLLTKELKYQNGDKRECLEFVQHILLIGEINELPKEITKGKGIYPLWLRGLTKEEIKKKNSYTTIIILIVIILFFYFILK